MYSIYALLDPRDDSIRYIGMTMNVAARVQAHMSLDNGTVEKNVWLRELMSQDMTCILWELEISENIDNARKRERHWIDYCLSGGEPLTNEGGPGVKSTRGRHSKKSDFDKILARYLSTGIHPWKDNRKMRHYIKKQYGIVVK